MLISFIYAIYEKVVQFLLLFYFKASVAELFSIKVVEIMSQTKKIRKKKSKVNFCGLKDSQQ